MTLPVFVGCAGGVSTGTGSSGEACAPEDITIVQSGRGLENEYYVAVDAGARAFAESKGLLDNYQWISSDGDSSKQLSQIKSVLAKSGECTVLNIDANESSIVPAIVSEVEKSGAWLVTQWNKPDDASPLDGSKHWVAHMSVDGVPQGYGIAKALFEKMGGKGKIVALQGILDNPPAKERFAGLQQALEEYPEIELIEDQTAGWDRTKAQDITQTWLTAHGDEIGGVWAAGDEMALGAREALLNAGRADVPVAGVDGLEQAIKLVAAGDGYAATTQSTGKLQGGYGLAIGFAAATGEIDPDELPAEKREFYLEDLPIVTQENAADTPAATDVSELDFSDVWAVNGRGM
ncbi:sugar ABC transporter substrate-binding protein [Leucobacter tenebrionis]|uniref:sugar ABC transporter substrate-binding protein n=1 Tax=Leucobacter tenebrionis TaxID=2873270 RepID=UPI001CA67A7A|nr:sugar ABC transporter substrate-binding protein [Leucobacter tenebrionis]QZY50917.1 sugar ABC transporter substrate-binding protein [Leucobacter tenebrionis]